MWLLFVMQLLTSRWSLTIGPSGQKGRQIVTEGKFVVLNNTGYSMHMLDAACNLFKGAISRCESACVDGVRA